jgi:hypothetical protein
MQLTRVLVLLPDLQVMSDFRPFFADTRNAKAVYRPRANARHEFSHAITLVGYNNQQQYWLAKNSYGSSWGDSGFFRVRQCCCCCCRRCYAAAAAARRVAAADVVVLPILLASCTLGCMPAAGVSVPTCFSSSSLHAQLS